MIQNALISAVHPLQPVLIKFDQKNYTKPVHYFKVEEIIQERLKNRKIDHDYGIKTLPLFSQGIKERFPDSPAHTRILSSVPFNERPAILKALYADGIDRDQCINSSQRHKIHCTYLKILNETNNGEKSKHEYELTVLANEETSREHWHEKCMQPFVDNLKAVIQHGIIINSSRHTVRLVQIMADGLKRAKIYGMKSNFNGMYPDPLTLVTKEDRKKSASDFHNLLKTKIRTKELYDEDVQALAQNQDLHESWGLVRESIWKSIPHFHIMDVGSAPSDLAHDINGGFEKTDIAGILVDLSGNKLCNWSFLSEGLFNLHYTLRFED